MSEKDRKQSSYKRYSLKEIEDVLPSIGKTYSFHWIHYYPMISNEKPMICLLYKKENEVYLQLFGDNNAYKFFSHPVIKKTKEQGYKIYLSEKIDF